MSSSDLAGAYRRVRNERHVFIRGVCGRSSSTALQRLLNSTNRICIFGEPWGSVDALLQAIATVEERSDAQRRKIARKDCDELRASFSRGRHDGFYPNAFRDTGETLLGLKGLLAQLLEPVNGVARFGFKDITLTGITTLEALARIFPAAQLVFLFRDPRTQWPSVARTGWFPYSGSLSRFLETYARIAGAYLEHAGGLEQACVVESSDLYDAGRVRALGRFLDLDGIDEGLIGARAAGDGAPPSAEPPPDDEIRRTIETSPAFDCYRGLRQLSRAFFGALGG